MYIQFYEAFRLFDDDETGYITLKNLRRVSKEIGESMNGKLEQQVFFFQKIMWKEKIWSR